MSRVQIPAAAVPGRLAVDVELAPGPDQDLLLGKLKAALSELQRRSGSAATPHALAPAVPAAATPPAPAPAAAAPAQPPAAAAAAAAAAVPLPVFPGGGPSRPPSAAAPAVVHPPAAAAPRPQQTVAPPPSTAGPSQAAPAAPAGLSWQCCWTTDTADHNGDPVASMTYLPQLAGLPGGEGHAGWLISSSRGLLNLWEASPSGGRGEPALMCMHSQGTDYASVCLDADRPSSMLLAASQDRSGGEWASAHSLDVESLLAPRGRCPMPHNPASKIAGQNCLAVASLSAWGGPLKETCVASYGGALVVWPVGSSAAPAAIGSSLAPRALWKAHDALITTLHRSSFGLLLFSGAADGKVHMYNMKEKPNKPSMQFTQQGRITGICQVNSEQVLTTAGDGRLMVWDLRQASTPLKFAIPDARPIVRMALSPFADCAAVATTSGIYSVDLLDSACHVSTVHPGAPQSPVTALMWNTATSEVVVAGGPGAAGSISVFRQQLGGH